MLSSIGASRRKNITGYIKNLLKILKRIRNVVSLSISNTSFQNHENYDAMLVIINLQ